MLFLGLSLFAPADLKKLVYVYAIDISICYVDKIDFFRHNALKYEFYLAF
jgi:hypothetical protein